MLAWSAPGSGFAGDVTAGAGAPPASGVKTICRSVVSLSTRDTTLSKVANPSAMTITRCAPGSSSIGVFHASASSD